VLKKKNEDQHIQSQIGNTFFTGRSDHFEDKK